MSAREAAITALADLAAHDTELPDAAIRSLAAWSETWRPEPPPADLIARPCAVPAARWHLDRLLTPGGDAVAAVRRAYHARMLALLLAPQRLELRPLVTILIPVYNRAGPVTEAVESCLAQDWRPLEILVVDDGSTDDPAGALRHFGDAVRVLRKPNGGVASARNAGLAAARGDFIHFLDSDNMLAPDAVSAKIIAFAAIADAELCYSAAQSLGYNPGNTLDLRAPTGSHMCPTTDLLRAVVQRYPFFVSTTMIARWSALSAARFEEDLRYHEDLRYWFTLGLRATKAIGLRSRLTIRRAFPGSLSDMANSGDDLATIVRLRGLCDLLRDPRCWIHVGPTFGRLLQKSNWSVAVNSGDPRADAAMRTLLAEVEGLTRLGQRGGLSILPLIGGLRHALWQTTQGKKRFDGMDHPMFAALAVRLEQAARAAAPISEADLAYWRQSSPIGTVNQRLHAWTTAMTGERNDPAALDSLDWILRRSWRIPGKRGLRRLLAWQRLLGSAWLARRLALAGFGGRRPFGTGRQGIGSNP